MCIAHVWGDPISGISRPAQLAQHGKRMRVIAAPQAKGIEALSTRPHRAFVHAVLPKGGRHFDASLSAATAFLSPLKDLAASSLSALLPVTTRASQPCSLPITTAWAQSTASASRSPEHAGLVGPARYAEAPLGWNAGKSR